MGRRVALPIDDTSSALANRPAGRVLAADAKRATQKSRKTGEKGGAGHVASPNDSIARGENRPATAVSGTSSASERPPILREIGGGGIGEVWMRGVVLHPARVACPSG